MERTNYSGYSVWPDGLSIWPSKKRSRRWDDLVSIRSAFSQQGNSLVTTMVFRVGVPLTLQVIRLFTFGTGPGRFAELIAQAVAAAPANTAIDELTFSIAQWGPREVRRRLYEQNISPESPALLLDRARHHRVWLEKGRARKAVETLLVSNPNHPEALQFRHQLMLEQGDAKRAKKLAEDWLARLPEDPRARVAVLQMRLAADESAAVAEAANVLEKEPGLDELAAGLAGYYFRAGEYLRAAQYWRRAAETTKDKIRREEALKRQRQAERTVWDTAFRWREKLMRWGRLTLAWSLLIGTLLLQGYRLYLFFTKKEREQEQQRHLEASQRQWAEEAKRHMEASNRQFAELTGRIMGNYPAVLELADKGDAAAELTLSEMLYDGSKGAPKNPATAKIYLEKSAAQGHRAALLSLGQKLVEGRDMPRDATRAAALFERAMDAGSPRAAAELAELHEKGDGAPLNKAKAYELYVRAANGGYVYAMTQAGWLLERGDGVPADQARALEFYRQAADKKSEWATERLFRLLYTPEVSSESRTEALKWLKIGARRGSAELRFQAAKIVLSGRWEDVELGQKKALEWLEEAVKAEQPGARTQLGLCLLNGWGVKQDFTRADEMFESASLQDPVARSLLARNIAFGVGMRRDLSRAKEMQATITDERYKVWLQTYIQAAEVIEGGTGSNDMPIQDQPAYPARLALKGTEGRAVVKFYVDPEGFTERVEVISATEPEFGCAARLAVSFWRFAQENTGRERHFQVPIEFKLSKELQPQAK